MNPITFPEANAIFGPPPDMTEGHVGTIHAFVGESRSGSTDGCQMGVTCWQPTPEEAAQIAVGAPIYLSFLGGLPPHFPTLCFHCATHPA